jgi:hypothetical protein
MCRGNLSVTGMPRSGWITLKPYRWYKPTRAASAWRARYSRYQNKTLNPADVDKNQLTDGKVRYWLPASGGLIDNMAPSIGAPVRVAIPTPGVDASPIFDDQGLAHCENPYVSTCPVSGIRW